MKTTTEVHKQALNSLITIGKEQGYLTYSEINDLLPEDLLTPEQVEPIVTILEELDIVVADEAPDADTLVMESGGKAQANSAEVAVAALAALDSEFGRTTDPVRMYMREMGVVELLEQKDEVRIAKEIEAGVYQIMKAITLYPKITDYFFKAYTRLEEGKCKMTDVVIGYQGDAEEFEEKQALIIEKQARLERWNMARLVKKMKKNLMSWNIRVQMKRKYINSLKKFKKALRPMLMLTRSMVILITKQSKLDRNSQSACQS